MFFTELWYATGNFLRGNAKIKEFSIKMGGGSGHVTQGLARSNTDQV